jgi:hypothetical protein
MLLCMLRFVCCDEAAQNSLTALRVCSSTRNVHTSRASHKVPIVGSKRQSHFLALNPVNHNVINPLCNMKPGLCHVGPVKLGGCFVVVGTEDHSCCGPRTHLCDAQGIALSNGCFWVAVNVRYRHLVGFPSMPALEAVSSPNAMHSSFHHCQVADARSTAAAGTPAAV